MSSVVDICNRALDKLGQSPIASFDDKTKAAHLCARNWPFARDQVLREHPWNFAVRRATLAPETATPDWGFANQFPLPSHALRLLEVRDHTPDQYHVEGRMILSDDETLYVRYIERVSDSAQYDYLFIDAVAARLAFDLVEPLTQNNTKKEAIWNEYQEALNQARFVDAQENPLVLEETDSWLSARL